MHIHKKVRTLRRFLIAFIIGITFTSCSITKPEIEITTTYVKNSSWRRNGVNVKISRLLPNQKLLDSDLNKISGYEIKHNTVIDAEYVYVAGVNDLFTKKLYFNTENKGFIWRRMNNLHQELKTISNLEPNNWYRFDLLYHSWVYYVYIDNEGKPYVWAINPVNI